MDYLELDIKLTPRNPYAEILVAQLSEIGFESFLETKEGVKAYVAAEVADREAIFSETMLGLTDRPFEYEIEEQIIAHQNWNAVWEADFEPVFVDDKLSILAPFHDQSQARGETIIIQPQMSFGTGHHQTTWMASKAMLELDTIPEKVLDMGTGTGILAILAEKLGAQDILAIDIEPWSAENTRENTKRNDCRRIDTQCGDIGLIEGKQFGLILANINKNILKKHMKAYVSALESKGKIILSGFFESDIDEMQAFCSPLGLDVFLTYTRESWAALVMTKNN